MADEEYDSQAGSDEDEDRVPLPEIWKLAAREPGHLRVLRHLRDPENAGDLRVRHPETQKSVMQFLFEECDEELFLKVLRKIGRDLLPVGDPKVFEYFDKFKEMTAPKEEGDEEEEEEEEEPEDEYDEDGNLIPRPPKPDLAQRVAAEIEEGNEFVAREVINCGIYAGDRLDSSRERHGFGGTLYTNGDLFVGEYKYGVRYEGVYLHATTKDVYWGPFNRQGLRQGAGKIWYHDDSFFAGDWVQGVREGAGKFVFPNKDTYEGDWADDCMHGRGVLSITKTSERLEGDWYRNTFMAGRWYQASGAIYYGLFRDFQPVGRGMYQLPNGIFELGSYSDAGWVQDRLLHKVKVEEYEESLTDWRSKLRNRIIGLGSVCPTTIQTDVYKATDPDVSLGANSLVDYPVLIRGLSAPPRPPTPPDWDDEGLEGEGVGAAPEVEELMKCHGFMVDTLKLSQWLNGFSDSACGIAAVGDDVKLSSCCGELRVLEDPSEESSATSVCFAVPKGKQCGTGLLYPGPSLSREHVRREDVWSNIRGSSVLLLDGTLLLNSAEVVGMVLEQATKQPKTQVAFKFPHVSTLEIVGMVATAVSLADFVFCTDLEMHSFAAAMGWKTNNLRLLVERLSKLYKGPRKQVIVLADALGDTYVMDEGELQVFQFPKRPEPEPEPEEEPEEEPEPEPEPEAEAQGESEEDAEGQEGEEGEEEEGEGEGEGGAEEGAGAEGEEAEEEEEEEGGAEEDDVSGEEEGEEGEEEGGEEEEEEGEEEGQEGAGDGAQEEGEGEGEGEAEEAAEEPEAQPEPEVEPQPEPEPEPEPEDPRSTVGVAPVNLSALAAGFVSQLSWPHATPTTAQCVRAGLYSVYAVNQGRSFEPIVDGAAAPRPIQLSFSRTSKPFELFPVRGNPDEDETWEQLALELQRQQQQKLQEEEEERAREEAAAAALEAEEAAAAEGAEPQQEP